jgi:hypothetical protein
VTIIITLNIPLAVAVPPEMTCIRFSNVNILGREPFVEFSDEGGGCRGRRDGFGKLRKGDGIGGCRVEENVIG